MKTKNNSGTGQNGFDQMNDEVDLGWDSQPNMNQPSQQQVQQQTWNNSGMQPQSGVGRYANNSNQMQNQNYQNGGQFQNVQFDNQQNQSFDSGFGEEPKKKKPIIKIVLLVVLILVVLLVVMKFISAKKNPVDEGEVLIAENNAASTLEHVLNNYDAYAIDAVVGLDEGDSYLAQEWAYVNRVQLREEYIQKICGLVRLVQGSGDAITATVPDYGALISVFENDKDYIYQLYVSSGYDPSTDYTFEEDMFNLFCQYMVDNVTIPTKEIQLQMPTTTRMDGTHIFTDDHELDTALFATDEFHELCKYFSQLCIGFTGYIEETYTVKEEVHNDEYDAWYAVFSAYYEADGGKFNKNTSMWEPWYLRDDNNEFILDENGEKIVNYYSVKDENGNDWIQPDEIILVEVEKTRQVETGWVEETGIPYVMLGTYYLQHEYTGKYPTVFRVGDGSADFPAGIGTTIVTKVLCDDGKYHNIRVALKGWWTGQNAIDYAEGFSSKNRGFTTTSPVKLITFEFTVENLEDEPVTFSSEMTICDKNSNIGSRTGTLYGFYEEVTLQPHEKVTMNDWASSTELDLKYVAWGKSFGRTFPMVYFDVLAGTGEIPSYSAYEQFTGKPSITEPVEESTMPSTEPLWQNAD